MGAQKKENVYHWGGGPLDVAGRQLPLKRWSLFALLLFTHPLLGTEVVDTFYSTYSEWGQPGSILVKLEIPEEGWIGSFSRIGNIGKLVECLEFSQDGFFYGVDVLGDSLVRIDPVTGEGAAVGNLGVFSTGFENSPDLSEDENGQLWMLAEHVLYRVDRATGIAQFSCQANAPVDGLTFLNGEKITCMGCPGEPGCGLLKGGPDFGGLEAGTDGWVYGFFPLAPTADGVGMIRVNPATGEQESIHALWWGYTLVGLSLGPAAPQQGAMPIPALSGRAAVAMCVLLAAAGFALLRRLST